MEFSDSIFWPLKNKRFHFVGIKGTGMAALAEIFCHEGAIVSGSDVSEHFYTDEILEKLGICALPFSEKNISSKIDCVIYSAAYDFLNEELAAAKKIEIPCILYTQALGAYSKNFFSCGICGVHGKTSTTGFAGTILKELPLDFCALAGSAINSFGEKCTCFSDSKNEKSFQKIFVAETCEYRKHFMSFSPKKILLTCVESDHQDFYPTYDSIRDAFVDYILTLPKNGDLIFCADDFGAVECAKIAFSKRQDLNLLPYGKNASGDFCAKFFNGEEKNGFSLSIFKDEKFFLDVPGEQEALDAAGAVALCVRLLLDCKKNPLEYAKKIVLGVKSFSGAKRRSEIIARVKNSFGDDILFVDDYAHHPTAIKKTLLGYKNFWRGKKILVDFMSHTYSRTNALLQDFSNAFCSADEVVLNKIYSSAREKNEDGDALCKKLFSLLQKNHKNAFLKKEFSQAVDFFTERLNFKAPKDFPNGYLFVTMGAGDNWKIGREVLKKFQKN